MGLIKDLFSGKSGPSDHQIRRAIKQATQPHGDASMRLSGMERLANWRTAESAAGLLRRFTVQVPQASMDQDEKQYAMRLLAQMGTVAVDPIMRYLKSEPEVTWPVRALREILPPEEFRLRMKELLVEMATVYTRWPEAKVVIIQHLPDESFSLMRPVILQYLQDDDDDVCIAAADYLARNGDEEIREKLIETFLCYESRPRVRGRVLDILCELEWPVKGYRKKMEEAISEPFYLTSKGTIKRRTAGEAH
jgi:hypothetical protein